MHKEFDSRDHAFMAQALRLAERGLYSSAPNPRVGCVIVKDDSWVGHGWHRRAGDRHAEIVALEEAGQAARDGTCYVTLEPCCHQGRTPPCTEALIHSGVTRVVLGMEDPNPKVAGRGIAALRDAGIAVDAGLNAVEAATLNPGFIARMRRGRPYVRIKLGAALDGRTASRSGQSQWITSRLARADVQRLRARSCAILSGIDTVLSDDPLLTVRDERFATLGRQPLRVIVDSKLRMPATARMLAAEGDTLILTPSLDAGRIAELEAAGAKLLDAGERGGAVDLRGMLRLLARLEVNELLVEAGPTLSGALIRAGLYDELIVYIAPKLLGARARGLVELAGLDELAEAPVLSYKDVRRIGPDLRVTLTPARRER